MKMKSLLLFTSLLVSQFVVAQASAQCSKKAKSNRNQASNYVDTRSDSINITHYSIYLDFSTLPVNELHARCVVEFKAKVNQISAIVLDLEGLTVDSVRQNGNILAFTHTDPQLSITLTEALNTNDSTSIEVFYQGTPVEDASGFGGFSFSGSFAYNIGVGFDAIPHNFGRVWFPCFDNFVERSTFTCSVITPSNLKAYCGGLLLSNEVQNNLRTMVWELNQEIPTYLASVAVAPFQEVNYTYNSLLNPALNVKLVALAADTTTMKNSFVSLEPIFHLFEEHFGPYKWDRVGYVSVPFQAGAMEHATNIAFPRDLLSAGASENQHIMAHELSHHWFGDLATCESAAHMWLNEGFASYTERLFDEWLISRSTYDSEVRVNHRLMLNYAHVRDGGYWPLSNVPNDYTYSNHTYELPSDKIHTLRTYMGDSLFFVGLKNYMSTYSFADANSNDLRDALEATTGLDLDDYFADWVDTPGWAGFEVDSTALVGAGVRVFYSQKSAGNSHNYQNVPFEITCRRPDFSLETRSALLSGPNGYVDIDIDFEPVMVYLNRGEKISQAVTGEERFIKTAANSAWTNALLEVDVNAIQDSVFLRVDHFWVKPDPFKQPFAMYRLSPNRYWKVDGILKPGFAATMKFSYNGRTASSSAGWLDQDLITDESKLVLLYRPDNRSDWQVTDAARTTFTSITDKFGYFVMDSVMLGEYVFAEIDSSLGIKSVEKNNFEFLVFPNPSKDFVELNWKDVSVQYVELNDLQGRSLGRMPVSKGDHNAKLPVSHLTAGSYLVREVTVDGRVETRVVQVN
jgi:aminopeptidase N